MRQTEFFCHFVRFFALFPLTTRKIKILKNEKNGWSFHHFTRVPKILMTWCTVPNIWCATHGWIEGWRKWNIKVDLPPKKAWHLKQNFDFFILIDNPYPPVWNLLINNFPIIHQTRFLSKVIPQWQLFVISLSVTLRFELRFGLFWR